MKNNKQHVFFRAFGVMFDIFGFTKIGLEWDFWLRGGSGGFKGESQDHWVFDWARDPPPLAVLGVFLVGFVYAMFAQKLERTPYCFCSQ